MLNIIRIIGKKGSNAVREIIDGTGILGYRGNKHTKIDLIINYGLAGDRLDRFFKLYPSAHNIPILNRNIGRDKLSVVQEASSKGIKTPRSSYNLPTKSNPKDWIEKKFNSIGGRGIRFASKDRPHIENKYFQEFVKDRKYELRVHAFSWLDDWCVQKRTGEEDTIAWNFHNGGVFQTIMYPQKHNVAREAISVSEKILKMLKMSFGAVDFIVDMSNN